MPKRKNHGADEADGLHSFESLGCTGALKGTILQGFRPRTQKTEIVLTEDVYPYADYIAVLQEDPAEWEDFVHQTARLPGFREWHSVERVREWLTSQSCKGAMASLGTDVEHTHIQVLSVGVSPSQFVENLDDETKEKLLTTAYSAEDLEALFPRPETSKKKHTLVLHRSGWRIKHVEPVKVPDVSAFELLLDFESGQELRVPPQDKKFLAITPTCGVFYESHPPSSLPKPTYHPFLESLTLGALKSLLQKLIRFRAPLVEIDGQEFPTPVILEQVMRLAAASPGTFVPHLQQFERGLPSWLKRMVVIAFEDSYVPGAEEILQSMALGALIATLDPDWRPSVEQGTKWFAFGHMMLASPHAVSYDCSKAGEPIQLARGLTALERVSAIVDILKSFPWDLTMIRHVARLRASLIVQQEGESVRVMPISHFWDHHIAPQLAYLCPKEITSMSKALCDSDVFGDLVDSKATPYAILFKALFQQVTGLNPRRRSDVAKHWEISPFVLEIRKAQEVYQALYSKKPSSLPSPDDAFTERFTWSLDPMWAAAAMGQRTVKLGSKSFYVFIQQVEPEIVLGVVRQPARNQRDTSMDPKDRELVIQQGTRIFQRAECELFGRRVTWNDLGEALTLEQRTRPGVCEFPCNLSLREFQRLEFLSAGYVETIELPRITRNGGSDARLENSLTVNVLDVAVSEFLRSFSARFPEVMTLQSDARSFKIHKLAPWWTMLAKWRGKWRNEAFQSRWSFHADSMERALHEDQANALSHFQERHAQGEKANMLIMPTGTGKSLVMMSYVRWLSDQNALPPYLLYIVPFSGMDSVIREMQAFTSQVARYDARKGKKHALNPYEIQVIDMNHGVRLADGDFDEVIANALIIVDELHLCLAATQRTACVQKLLSAAKMSIACTATPSIDNNIYNLLPFLRPLVKFPVTASSFFIGYSAVEEQTKPTDIKVEEVEMYVEVEEPEYRALLPSRLGGLNPRRLEMAELNRLFEWALLAATDKAVEAIIEAVEVRKERPFIAAVTRNHAMEIQRKLQETRPDIRIKAMTRQEDVETLTDPKLPIDVVIVTMKVHAGYSVTICNSLFLFVWPSNSATRTQVRGRINRRSSPFKTLRYVTVYAGALQRLTLQKQDKCDSFAAILRDVCKQ